MPAARSHDPSTSHAAARSAHNPTEVQLRILHILRLDATHNSTGLTDEQIHDRYQNEARRREWVMPTAQSLRSRRAELERKGKVRPTGSTILTRSGRKTRLWELVT
jgi:hypothetical protein